MNFFIVNTADRPCRRLIAVQVSDNAVMYVDERVDNPGQFPINRATPVQDFGFNITKMDDNRHHFTYSGGSVARYQDGSTRRWQPESDEEVFFDITVKPSVVDVMVENGYYHE